MTVGKDDGNDRSIRRRQLLWAWLPTALYGGLILFFALQPAPRLPRIKHVDKYAHVVLYGILSLLAYRSLLRSAVRMPSVHAVLIALAVGMADEGVQFLGGVRTADRYDLLADGIGAVLAMTAAVLVRTMGRTGGRSKRQC